MQKVDGFLEIMDSNKYKDWKCDFDCVKIFLLIEIAIYVVLPFWLIVCS